MNNGPDHPVDLGCGFQRPFELATIRLRNMAEVLGHWRTYVPLDDFMTQRCGTFLLDANDTLFMPTATGASLVFRKPWPCRSVY